MRVFDRRYELMPRAELEQLQIERLQALLVRLKRNVRRYRELVGDIRVESLDDLSKLPATTPDDVAQSFPYGMFALPLREVIRLHSTMGPDGCPLVIGHTQNDLSQWGRLVARQLVASGVTANDVVMITLGGGLYRGALGYALGAETIEASVIAEEPYHIDAQLAILQSYRPTMLITSPANTDELIRVMESRRIDPQSLYLRTLLLSRPVDADMRERFKAAMLVAVQCNFGVEQVLDPGLCVECEAGRFHVNEDQFLVEVENGELLLTTLVREAMPLLRYRTRMACEIVRDKCPCGRTSVTLLPGDRLDGRVRVNEIPLYEKQIAEVLAQTPVAGNPFTLRIDERKITIEVEMTSVIFSDMIWPIMHLQRNIESEFLARLGIEAEIVFTAPPSGERQS